MRKQYDALQEFAAVPLNPQVEALLASYAGMPAIDYSSMTAPAIRAIVDQPIALKRPPQVETLLDIVISSAAGPVPARLYGPVKGAEPGPITVFFHGGGWVFGTLETHDATCRALASASGIAVLSVGYRLAPENPFPAGLVDALAALEWIQHSGRQHGIDPDRVAVAGDSAGGNLAAAVAILAVKRSGPPIRHQLLFYPVTDRAFDRGSYVEHGGGDRLLSTEAMRWFWQCYVGDDTPELAAIYRIEQMAGLPPATVITAEYDPLLDEGMAYAARLADAGVAVEARIAKGMIHGFISLFDAVPDAWPWIDYAAARLQDALR